MEWREKGWWHELVLHFLGTCAGSRRRVLQKPKGRRRKPTMPVGFKGLREAGGVRPDGGDGADGTLEKKSI